MSENEAVENSWTQVTLIITLELFGAKKKVSHFVVIVPTIAWPVASR